MMLLPKDVGPFTLLRKIGTGAVAESYLGRLNTDGGREVVVRRVLPYILRDAARLASTEARVRDLVGVRHPFLVQVLDWVEDGDERFIVEDRVDGIDLERVLAWCRAKGEGIPHNVFLNLATQVCNGLEALHGRPGRGSGSDNVLHLGLRPGAILVTADGKVVLGGFGLTRSPTTLSHGGVSAPVPTRMEYLSPEQTQPDKKLSPASDIFALGAVLYELLTLQPLFRSDSNLQTINRIRRAEVTTQLLKIKEKMPGLDKVLYRALSLNPRHRYQRAFVLREDLRGLMAGYSFSTIVDDTRAFFGPMVQDDSTPADAPPTAPVVPAPPVMPELSSPPPETAETVEASLSSEPSAEELAAAGIGSGTPDLSAPASASGLALGAGVASQVAATFSDHERPGGALPPAVPLPETSGFEDDVATRIERAPASTAALAADAVRAHMEQADPPDAPVDEVPAPIVPAPSEELADRSTLPIPPTGSGDDERTDVAVSVAAAVGAASLPDPNSTRAFLRGEGAPDLPSPPPAAPDPSSSGIGDLRPGTPLAAPPPSVPGVPVSTGPSTAAPSPAVAAPLPAVAAPASDASARLAAAAPPPAAAAPPPAVAAPPPVSATPVSATPVSDDDFVPPKRGNGVMIGAAVGMVVLILACALGGYALTRLSGGEPDGLADAEPAEEAPPTIDDALAAAAGDDAAGNDAAGNDDAGNDDAGPAATQTAPPPIAPVAVPADDPPAQPVADRPSRTEPVAAPASRPSTTSSWSAPSSTPSSTASSTASRPASSSSSSSRSRVEDQPVADLGEPQGDTGTPQATDVERYAAPASGGKLTSSDIMALETVQIDDPSYTRSRALLLMNAQRKGEASASKRYLEQLMVLPENQYNPIYLSDLGRYHVNRKQYETALQKATLAERYWARLPPELVFSKKAEIYETQASAWQGRFYQSGDDLEMLDQAIRHWQKYRDHVETKSRSDLARKAEGELAKLEDIKSRLQ